MRNNCSDSRRIIAIAGMALALLVFFGIITYNVTMGREVLALPGGGSFLSTSTPTPTPVPCTKPRHAGGDSSVAIISGGVKRTFLLHLPPDYGQHLQPLVVGYHGYSWTSQFMENVTRLNVTADHNGFILAMPQGVDSPPSWNAGNGPYGPTADANDVQFSRDLLAHLTKNYCVDAHRVYLTGFSLGGGMVYRVACALSEQITAIATVSGAYYPFGGCHPARPLPVLEIHGAVDTEAPYDGSQAMHIASVHDYLSVWRSLDKCSSASHVIMQTNNITGTAWSQCASDTEVVHYRIANGDHHWPGEQTMDTNATIWEFFSNYSR